MELTGKQRAFIEQYFAEDVKENASEAFRRVYGKRYKSDKAIATNAYKMLIKPKVKAEIERLRAKKAEKLELSLEWLDKELVDCYVDCKGTDKTNAKGFLQLIGQRMAAYKDVGLTSDLDKQRELSESEAVEAKRIASIRLADIA